MQCGVNLQERLANFMNMSSEAFEEDCTTLMKDVQKFNVPNMYMFGRSLAILAFFNERCIYWVTQATVSLAKNIFTIIIASKQKKMSYTNLELRLMKVLVLLANFTKLL